MRRWQERVEEPEDVDDSPKGLGASKVDGLQCLVR